MELLDPIDPIGPRCGPGSTSCCRWCPLARSAPPRAAAAICTVGMAHEVLPVRWWWVAILRNADANISYTPWKINMEPTNHPFRKENDLPNLHDYVPCILYNLQGCKHKLTEIIECSCIGPYSMNWRFGMCCVIVPLEQPSERCEGNSCSRSNIWRRGGNIFGDSIWLYYIRRYLSIYKYHHIYLQTLAPYKAIYHIYKIKKTWKRLEQVTRLARNKRWESAEALSYTGAKASRLHHLGC